VVPHSPDLSLLDFFFWGMLTLWHPGGFRDFQKKKHLTHVVFRGNFSGLVCSTDLVKVSRRGKFSSLHSKKKILFGWCRFFVSDVISGGILGHLGPLCLALGASREVVVFR